MTRSAFDTRAAHVRSDLTCAAGTFDVLCAELCGAAHAQMRAKVIIEEEGEYHAWLEQQKTFAELSPANTVVKAAYQSGGK